MCKVGTAVCFIEENNWKQRDSCPLGDGCIMEHYVAIRAFMFIGM